jgi:HlyD family secretion protein
VKTFIIIAVIGFVLVGAILGLVVVAGHYATAKVSDLVPTVRLEKPTRGDLSEIVRASGTIEPKTKVGISARVSALILELPHREGQAVTKGNPDAKPPVPPSVLVRLDDKDLQATLRSAESRQAGLVATIEVSKTRLETARSSIKGLRINLEDANKTLAREKDLFAKGVESESNLDAAQCLVDKYNTDLAGAENSLKADEQNLIVMGHDLAAAQAEVGRCQDALTYTTIMSPIDGIVTRVNAEVGEMAIMGTMNNAGTEILQVADMDNMLLRAEVDETFIGDIHPGQKAKVHIQAFPKRVFEGTVDSVALVCSTSTRTGSKYFEARILVAADGERILSGLTADVDIVTSSHTGVLKVPSQAVLGRRTEDLPPAIRDNNPQVPADKAEVPVVYRFVDGKAVVTPVTLGAADALCTEIKAGLDETSQVIVGPFKALDGLKHDQAVRDDREVKKDDAVKKDAAEKKDTAVTAS